MENTTMRTRVRASVVVRYESVLDLTEDEYESMCQRLRDRESGLATELLGLLEGSIQEIHIDGFYPDREDREIAET